MSGGVAVEVKEEAGRMSVGGSGRGLSERCTHQTRGGFRFCVKSRYQTGTGFASREKEAGGGGAERQEEEEKKKKPLRHCGLSYPAYEI